MITEEDKEFIKENYKKIPIEEIAEKIGKSKWTIYSLVQELGVGNHRWTEEEIDLLKQYYEYQDWDFMMRILGINNKQQIAHKASELGLRVRKFWSKEDDEILKNYYPILDWENIFNNISDITKDSVYKRTKFLGIAAESHWWSDEEIELLKNIYPYYPASYLVEKYFPTRKSYSINMMARKNGIKKDSSQNNKFFVPEKMINDLKLLGEKLGRTPSIEELKFYGLPSDKSYDRYIGGYKKACNLAGLEVNVSLWGKAKIYFSKNNDVCYSHSELVITNFLIDNGIMYEKEKLYNTICDDIRCGTKRMDWFINNEYIVEYWGYPNVKSYISSMDTKQEICRDYNLKIVDIYRKDLRNLPVTFNIFINKNL